MASSSIKEMIKKKLELEDRMRVEYSRYNELLDFKSIIKERLSCVKRCRSILCDKYGKDKLDKLYDSKLQEEIRYRKCSLKNLENRIET